MTGWFLLTAFFTFSQQFSPFFEYFVRKKRSYGKGEREERRRREKGKREREKRKGKRKEKIYNNLLPQNSLEK